MKTVFELENCRQLGTRNMIRIIGKSPKDSPYVSIETDQSDNPTKQLFIKDKDLELFVVNILKALNSKRVLQGKVPYYKLKKHKSIK